MQHVNLFCFRIMDDRLHCNTWRLRALRIGLFQETQESQSSAVVFGRRQPRGRRDVDLPWTFGRWSGVIGIHLAGKGHQRRQKTAGLVTPPTTYLHHATDIYTY